MGGEANKKRERRRRRSERESERARERGKKGGREGERGQEIIGQVFPLPALPSAADKRKQAAKFLRTKRKGEEGKKVLFRAGWQRPLASPSGHRKVCPSSYIQPAYFEQTRRRCSPSPTRCLLRDPLYRHYLVLRTYLVVCGHTPHQLNRRTAGQRSSG